MVKQLVLSQDGSLTDAITFTVVPRAIYRRYPGKYRISVRTPYPDIWIGNRFIQHNFRNDAATGVLQVVEIATPEAYAGDKHGRKHLMQLQLEATCVALKRFEVEELPLTEVKPDITLSSKEYWTRPSPRGVLEGKPYWLVCTGWTNETSTGAWDGTKWEQVVNRLATSTAFLLAQIRNEYEDSVNKKMKMAVNLRDLLTVRETIWLMHHARGVITTNGALVHMAAALCKPCVVVAGASQEPRRASYTEDSLKALAAPIDDRYQKLADVVVAHKYLVGNGKCPDKGCRISSVASANPEEFTCPHVIKADRMKTESPNITQARCIHEITTDVVTKAVLAYEKQMKSTRYDEIDALSKSVVDSIFEALGTRL